MIRIRTLLCAASAACGLALGFNAYATTFTFDLPCDSLTANGNSITCNTSGGTGPTASCSLSPLNKSVAIPGIANRHGDVLELRGAHFVRLDRMRYDSAFTGDGLHGEFAYADWFSDC